MVVSVLLDIFNGITSMDWGIKPGDIWGSVMGIVGTIWPFLLLGIVMVFGGKIIDLLYAATVSKGDLETFKREYKLGRKWFREDE